MAKVTSKLQVTVPKAVADRFGIRPGDDIEWIVDGTGIRVVRETDRRPLPVADRLKVFDEATTRQQARNRAWRRRHQCRLAPRSAGGRERRSTRVAALVDTNVLVYRFDPRFPDKQATATRVLRD